MIAVDTCVSQKFALFQTRTLLPYVAEEGHVNLKRNQEAVNAKQNIQVKNAKVVQLTIKNTQISDAILTIVRQIAAVRMEVLMRVRVDLVAIVLVALASTRALLWIIIARSAESPGVSGQIHMIV